MHAELKHVRMRSCCRSVCRALVCAWNLDLRLGQKLGPDLVSQAGV